MKIETKYNPGQRVVIDNGTTRKAFRATLTGICTDTVQVKPWPGPVSAPPFTQTDILYEFETKTQRFGHVLETQIKGTW